MTALLLQKLIVTNLVLFLIHYALLEINETFIDIDLIQYISITGMVLNSISVIVCLLWLIWI